MQTLVQKSAKLATTVHLEWAEGESMKEIKKIKLYRKVITGLLCLTLALMVLPVMPVHAEFDCSNEDHDFTTRFLVSSLETVESHSFYYQHGEAIYPSTCDKQRYVYHYAKTCKLCGHMYTYPEYGPIFHANIHCAQ
jgi:hypothetical protein